ncbi:MAG: aldo/keto reductase [Rhodocyclaceae bacterium]|nr:aldo/keto reductase [Rhodocyclaceae bacterium]
MNASPPVSRSRRRLLGGLAASAALPLSSPARGAPMAPETRPVPSSGERLPVVGLGTYRSFDIGTSEAERAPVQEVLRRFVDAGGRVIDSSPMYGRAEATIGALAGSLGVGERLFHATKVWTEGREAGIAQMQRSFARMGVARMDLMQVHNLLDVDVHLDTLRGWKADGRVRYIGVTHYHEGAYDALATVLQRDGIDFVQLNYSIVEREADRHLLPLAAERGIAVLVNRPFAKGGLFRRVRGQTVPAWAAEFGADSWARFFLKFILGHPAVTCAIPATGKPAHLDDNMGAGRGPWPDASTRERMWRWVEDLPG